MIRFDEAVIRGELEVEVMNALEKEPLNFATLASVTGYSQANGSHDFRHLDRVLQRLRKRGLIRFVNRKWHTTEATP